MYTPIELKIIEDENRIFDSVILEKCVPELLDIDPRKTENIDDSKVRLGKSKVMIVAVITILVL